MQYSLNPPPLNPLTRLLATIVAVLAIAGAFFFGLFVLALLVAFGLFAWLALWLRIGWARKKGIYPGVGPMDSENMAGNRSPGESGSNKGDVLDAEYTVVSRQDED